MENKNDKIFNPHKIRIAPSNWSKLLKLKLDNDISIEKIVNEIVRCGLQNESTMKEVIRKLTENR